MNLSPFHATRIVVVKVASRCNLACTYCYMYHHPDQNWKHQPKFITKETIAQIVDRLQEYASNLDGPLMVVAHGGEPLLYPGLDYFFDFISHRVKDVLFAIQTNGTLLNDKNIAILDKYQVRTGVSIDGNRDTHNKSRITIGGEGSYDQVLDGVKRARAKIPHLFDSVLQVIDTQVPPLEMLEILESYGVNRADLLLPDLNNDTMAHSSLKPGDIGHWLIEVFDYWVKRPTGLHIRFFLTIMELLLGKMSGTDQLGLHSAGVLMIETDGSYHVHDGLKTAFHGAGITNMTVRDTSIAEVEKLPLSVLFRNKAQTACATCQNCSLFSICGGGSPIHRYSKEREFDNPSVFCKDLELIITHIENYLLKTKPLLRSKIEKAKSFDAVSAKAF